MDAAERGANRAFRHAQRQAEVGQNRVAVGGNHDVRGLDVAVNHAFTMGVIQRAGDVADDTQNIYSGHARVVRGVFLEDVAQVAPLDEHHRHVEQVFILPGLVDADNLWVAQAGDGTRLAHEALAVLVQFVGMHPLRVEDFYRRVTLELVVIAPVDTGHTPLSYRRVDLIIAKFFPNKRVAVRHKAAFSLAECKETKIITNLG